MGSSAECERIVGLQREQKRAGRAAGDIADADGPRLQVGVVGKGAASQIEYDVIAADSVEGHLDGTLGGVRLVFGDAGAHFGHAGIGDG